MLLMVTIRARYARSAICRLNESIRNVKLYNPTLTFLARIKNSNEILKGAF